MSSPPGAVPPPGAEREGNACERGMEMAMCDRKEDSAEARVGAVLAVAVERGMENLWLNSQVHPTGAFRRCR